MGARDSSYCRVKPMSWNEVREIAFTFRKLFDPNLPLFCPVLHIIEHVLPYFFPRFHLDILPDDDLEGREAETFPGEPCIRARESVYIKACADDPRSRYTLCHELGHLLLHRPQNIILCYSHDGVEIPPYENPERQADVFAAEFLAPLCKVAPLPPEEMVNKCGISLANARIQARCVSERWFACTKANPRQMTFDFI